MCAELHLKLVLLLACVCVIAGAAPGAARPAPPPCSPERQTAPPAPVADARLSRPITISAPCTDLGRFARDLARQTGVVIRVRPDIANEKITAIAKGYPLGHALRNVVDLLGYRLSAEGGAGAKPSYLIWRDSNRRAAEERLRADKQTEQARRREARMDTVRSVMAMSDADVDALPEDQAEFARYARSPMYKPAFQFLASLTPRERKHLLDGGLATRRLATADRQFRDGILGSFVQKGLVDHPDAVTVADIVFDNKWTPNTPLQPDRFYVRVGDGSGAIAAYDVGLTPEAMKGLAPQQNTEAIAANMKAFKALGGGDDLSDPRLRKKVPAPAKGGVGFSEMLQAVSEATGTPMFSDYYTTGQAKLAFTEDAAHNVVWLFCNVMGHQWASRRDALLFRFDDWPTQMTKEAPLAVLDALKAAGEPGMLNFAQSLAASDLSPDQLTNLRYDGYHVPWIRDEDVRLLLRAVASLSGEQRQRLWADGGLDFAMLPQSARDAFGPFYDARWTRHGYAPVILNPSAVRPSPESSPVVFRFKIFIGNQYKVSEIPVLLRADKGGVRPSPAAAQAAASG